MEGIIENDKWTGDWVYYNPNGKLHKRGAYINSLQDGVWQMYNLNGQIHGTKNYDKGKLLEIDFLDKKKEIYYEYNFEITDAEKINFTKSFNAIENDEYVLFEPVMLSNIQFLEENPLDEKLGIISQFVSIWTSNCPYLGGELKIEFTDFTTDWATLDDNYEYNSLFTVFYLIGKCAYLIENRDNTYDLVKSEYRATESMVKAYKAIIDENENAKNLKMDEICKKYDRKILKEFIRSYIGE